MIPFFWYAAPLLLLSLASIGAGILCLVPVRALHLSTPRWLFVAIAYLVGQGVLATAFLFAALAGRFSTAVVSALVWPCVLITVVACARSWGECRSVAARARDAWRAATWTWKLLTAATVLLFVYGFSTIAGHLWVDAPAFYMAMAKLIAGTQRLTTLPGYDTFSAVGLYGELHMAALYRLGMSDTAPRVLGWVSFIPAIAVVYGLARICGLGRRGSVLAVAIAVSSSSVALLWGGGKTDLLAVGPALAACAIVVSVWDRQRVGSPLLVVGLLTGFSAVAKASYLVAFLPGVVLLVCWQRVAAMHLRGGGVRVTASIVSVTRAMIPFAAGFLLAFVPNLFKNYVILGAPLASYPIDPYFTPATTTWLLLTYPFAVTFGRYWGQMGTLSPLLLALAPMVFVYLRKPADWISSRLLAVTMVGVAGLAAWLILFPSVITIRYFQATLLVFAIPVAAAGELAVRQSRLLSWVIPLAVLTAVIVAPAQTDIWIPSFTDRYRTVVSAVSGPHGPCSGSRPFQIECSAHTVINERAKPGDRVLLLTYVRFWLRPDLIASLANNAEVRGFFACERSLCSIEQFWAAYRAARPRFRFILIDSNTHTLAPGVFDTPPSDIHVQRVFSARTTTVYEVRVEGP